MENLRHRTLSGLGWTGGTQVLGQALQLAISVILARQLSPREFGLIGMVLVFTVLASSLSNMGLGASIIQNRAVSNLHLNSIFWLNITVGSILTLLFGLAAPLVASFYDEPAVQLLTVAVAITIVLNSLNIVQEALLDKSLSFRTKFWVDFISISTSGVLALVMAWAGAGVWCLVGQLICAAAIRVVVMWRMSNWRPGISFELSAVKELMQFGGPLVVYTIINYLGTHFDKLAIGRLMGSSALGIYNLADRLMRLPLTNVTGLTHTVMFPALSAMQEDDDAVKRVYLRANRMIALLTFPMMIGLSVLAEPAILVVYGDKWRGTIELVQILCFAGMYQSVCNTAGWIFLSRGRTDILLRLGIYTAFVRMAGVFVGYRWGVIGIAWAYMLGGYFFICYPTWFAAGRLIHLRVRDMVRNMVGPLCCATAMGVLIWISDEWVFAEQSKWIRLVVQVPCGILVYWFLIQWFQLEAWGDVRMVLLEKGGGRNRFIRWLLSNDSIAKS